MNRRTFLHRIMGTSVAFTTGAALLSSTEDTIPGIAVDSETAERITGDPHRRGRPGAVWVDTENGRIYLCVQDNPVQWQLIGDRNDDFEDICQREIHWRSVYGIHGVLCPTPPARHQE